MNREIKFMAWDTIDEKMRNVEFIDFKDQLVKLFNDYTKESYFRRFEEIKLLQYTGLKDKNSVDIYEGDLLEDKEKLLWEVELQDETFIMTNAFIPGSQYIYKGLLKAGNIYENSGLLKEV
ncbi:YopX family protein [Clostridium sp. MSJ-11]|uniref:YopX family protein n=1 Tax=Clostridium mobile TaxID=2841512 RepID=A0ABS6EMH0_9CLOT|nr:YopX family protein [Clostridium mobile]MBU5486437.1 YopX family protein [Clostridium mobile]